MAVQLPFDLGAPLCAYPHAPCDARATRTLDLGLYVVAACDVHRRSAWWAACEREAGRALDEARRRWDEEGAR